MSFPELQFLENLLETLGDRARVRTLAKVPCGQLNFPIQAISLGRQDPEAPTFLMVGGVHGQEKIGSQVVLSFLETVAELLNWDKVLQLLLERSRLIFIPILNPVGMFLLQRSNGNGVDLMRNAPIEGNTAFLLGGQRISPALPWYRGKKGDPMEVEAQALCDFVREEVFPAKIALALDCHSGYGSQDRLWFPYSYTTQPFPHLAEAYSLKTLLDNTYPNHVYRMEPNSHGYTISGDLWDYLYETQRTSPLKQNLFFPVTLEMGSWNWIKKNPIQILDAIGLFHPIFLHRHKRILRRHLVLLDFFHRAVISSDYWTFLPQADREELRKEAIDYWYKEE